MNRTYQTIWNEQTCTYVAVSEHTKGRGKRSGSVRIAVAIITLAAMGGAASADDDYFKIDLIGTPTPASASNGSVAIGSNSVGEGNQSIAIGSGGDGATATEDGGVAIGALANASVAGGVALGSDSVADRVAQSTLVPGSAGEYGYMPEGSSDLLQEAIKATQSRSGAVSVGGGLDADSKPIYRQITNVAAGTVDTDAVNVAQLKALSSIVTEGQTHYYSVNGSGGIYGNYANDGATGHLALAAGVGAVASGGISTSVGYDNVASGSGSTSVGRSNTVSGNSSSAIGQYNTVLSSNSYALGGSNQLGDTDGEYHFVSGEHNTVGGEGNYGLVLSGGQNTVVGDANQYVQLGGYQNSVQGGSNSALNLIGMSNSVVGDNSSEVNIIGAGNNLTGTNQAVNVIGRSIGVDSTEEASVIGSGVTVADIYRSNIMASNSTVTNGSRVLVMGTDLEVNGATSSIIIADNATVADGLSGVVLLGKEGEVGMNAVNAVVIGTGASATEGNATAIGALANASVAGGVALGSDSLADRVAQSTLVPGDVGEYGYMPGSASDEQQEAIKATQSRSGAVSVGGGLDADSKPIYRQITNVAAGTVDTDAVNVAQLKAVEGIASSANQGWNIKSNSALASTQVKPGDTVDIGLAAGEANLTRTAVTDAATGETTIAFGLKDDLVVDSVTTGNTVMDTSGITVSGGANGPVLMTNMGLTAGTVVISSATGIHAGDKKITGVQAGTELTDAVNVSQLNELKDSIGDLNLSDRAVMYDGTTGDPKSQITLEGDVSNDGGKTGGTTITNVARGDISENSTDAVNGSQIHEMGDSMAQGMGGNSRFEDGQLVTELNVGGDTYSNVNDALNGLNTDIENIEQVANAGWNVQTNGGTASKVAPGGTVNFQGDDNIKVSNDGLNVTVAMADDIKVNSITAVKIKADTVTANSFSVEGGGPVIDANGIDMSGQTISNVAAGVNETDAVNVGQLQQATGNVQNQVNNLRQDLRRQEKKLSAGVAAAMATASLPQAYLPGKNMMSMAGGTWNGESGMAIGFSGISDNGQWVYKLSGNTSSRGDYGGAVGIGYQW